jgi:hypothetical protein
MKAPAKTWYNIQTDGITQGLLNNFRTCRESTLLFLSGWSQKGSSMALTFGNIVHAVLELIYGDIQKGKLKSLPALKQVHGYILTVEKIWEKENPKADQKLLEMKEFAFLLAEAIMPIYFEFWHKDLAITWMGLEQQFTIPYALQDGRKTVLRGKMDGLYKKGGIWLFETKSKSRIDEGTLVDVLPMDFQNNFYLSCVRRLHKIQPAGARYNIIRRTGMSQGKKENIKQFSQRVVEDIRKRPEYYFMRFELSIGKEEMNKFDSQLADQFVEFYNWWETLTGKTSIVPASALQKIAHYPNPSQCETKYGRCWALDICAQDNYRNYEKRSQVFRELEDF